MVEYITGMDTRIGYPNEHLAGDSEEEIASPLYATGVGLLMSAVASDAKHKPLSAPGTEEVSEAESEVASAEKATEEAKAPRKNIFDKWSEKLKDFLDNAE